MKRFLIWLILLVAQGCKEDSIDCIDRSKIKENAACPYVLQEVCGCDGKTYSNACVAENSGVAKWADGKCP
jgi:Kazal-type serine protease inhibitor domain